MHHINHRFFLSFIALSILIGEVRSENAITKFVIRYSKDGGTNIIDSNEHILKVCEDGILHDSFHLLICKGTYDGIPVAIKFAIFGAFLDREISVLEALNAMNDANAEANGIPKVYYVGNVFGTTFRAIAMSLFEETVEQRYMCASNQISDLTILLIFKQAVKTLAYLNSKDVVHNDIKPENLFLRGTQVFIADFDLSALNGTQVNGFTNKYASSNWFAHRNRFPMDDLESLIYSMWHVAGFESLKPYGSILFELKGTDEAKPWLTQICKGFMSEIVQKVFRHICIDEILSEREVPQYENIIEMLSGAITEVIAITEQT